MKKLFAVAAALLAAYAAPVAAQTPTHKMAASVQPPRSTDSNTSASKSADGTRFVGVPPAQPLVDDNRPSLPMPRQPAVQGNPAANFYGLNGGGG